MLTRLKGLFEKRALLLVTMFVFLVGIVITSTIVYADAEVYYNIRINYYFKDGTPARDAYVATFEEGADVDLTVTNPDIDGFVPMTAAEGGESALTTEFHYTPLDGNKVVNVYYIAGLTHYRALYYKQNLYDDLYTRDNTLPANMTDRYGYTGSNPTDLEDVQFEGFTNLFHEPDAIAADGSTVFRVYYDRNYYSVKFDLGEHGYGLDPVYAKYQSAYHITEPKRLGFTFKGWLRTDKDSTKGTYAHHGRGTRSEDTSWKFIDENGDELVDSQGNPIFDEHGIPKSSGVDGSDYYLNFTEGTIPAHDTYYKAIWESGTTSYSVVYWFQNPDGKDLTAEELNAAGSIGAARSLISSNYSVAAAKDVENVPSGTPVNLETYIPKKSGGSVQIKNFFGFDLSDGENGDFPTMSDAKREELQGKAKLYEYAADMSQLQFGGAYEEDQYKTHIEIMGDGTTRINVYFDRKDFTLKFYYARRKLVNGEPTGDISLTNRTKGFSNKQYGNNNNYIQAVEGGYWQDKATEELPRIKDEYLVENGGILTEKYTDYNGWRYYYYQVKAQYGEPLKGKWLIDAITKVPKRNFAGQYCEPGSWAVEYYTKYYESHTAVNNFTIKGIYEKLGDELMFETRKTSAKDNTLQELHYVLSWTNTSPDSPTNAGNFGVNHVLHFKYQNYVELLPRELDKMKNDSDNDGNPDGPNALIDDGVYEDIYLRKNEAFTHVDPSAPFVYDPDAKYYGLKHDNIIDTIDSGSQYDSASTRTMQVYVNQVPTTMTGFKLVNYREYTGNETDISATQKSYMKKGQVVVTEKNAVVDWTGDSSSYRKATIKYFYNRLTYTLKWRNGNRLEEAHTREVMYGAPLNSVYKDNEDGHQVGDYRYWFENPIYFNEDLRDYYNFIGWYYTPYYYRMVDKDTATMPADDTTLYARWDPKIIDVSFYPTYNDYYSGTNRIGEAVPVHYGDYMSTYDIPANVEDDPENLRPDLNPPTSGAMFAGWYYIRDNVPVRFDPESVPITALNNEASAREGARLRLYAEWATKDAAKYQISYVEKDHPEREVADPTTGRAFVWKTKTFEAKAGSELNEEHAWTENGVNWWPTTKSHSLIIKANSQGHLHEYEPNVFTFEYIQKRGVYYRVQYLDAASRTPLLDPAETGKDEVYSTHGSIKEDAPFIPGYTAEKMTQSMVLTASAESDPDAQKADELATNVLTFYYNKNEKDYTYEVEYYKQNVDDDDYTHYLTENFDVEIADDPDTAEVERTYVTLSDLFDERVPKQIISDGFTRVVNGTKVTVSAQSGDPSTTSVADNARIEISGNTKTTIKIYFDRNEYDYVYQYVDYHAEKDYLALPENERDGKWNGILETFDQNTPKRVDSEVTIPAPRDKTYTVDGESVPYTRLSTNDVILTIAPTNPENPDVNLIKVYYKKFYERELNYKLVCQNEDNPYTEVDYDETKNPHQPLFGGLSMTLQTVDDYSKINDVSFYNFNNAKDSNGVDLHNHRYTFLGWYDNPEGEGEPLVAYDEANPKKWETLTKANLGLEEGKLPERDTTYYAVVKQDMVKADFEFRIVDEDLPIGGDPIDATTGETEKDLEAAEIVRNAQTDPDGSYTGSFFAFSDPFNYENGSPLPYHKHEGYTVDILPKENDNRVYKYEFTEWWEEDLKTGKLIRKKNWNVSGEWGAPTSLQDQLDRTEDKHVIAVFKRRTVTELPYSVKYEYKDRNGNDRTYTVKGTLSGDDLDDRKSTCKITNDGYYRLNDEFVLENAPYESNHGETLRWKDTKIEATSILGNSEAEKDADKVDHMVATITAEQNSKAAYANYKLLPSDDEFTTIGTTIGANRKTDEKMEAIDARGLTYEGKEFSYWEIRKTDDPDDEVIARCYEPWFTFCMMDNYYITPVYNGTTSASEDPDYNDIKLRWLDYSRNRWTDENGDIAPSGISDLLYCDFEISFNNKDKQIFEDDTDSYETGVVFELCTKLPEGKTFVQGKDYGYASDPDNLKNAILNKSSVYYYSGSAESGGKRRSLQFSNIPTEKLTNKNRIEFYKSYKNAFKENEGVITYTNNTYVMKVYAYLIDKTDSSNPKVTLSNYVYVCLNDIGNMNMAINGVDDIVENTPDNG